MIRFLLLVFAGIFVTTPASAQNNNAVLWRIQSPDGGLPSYLFGTVHLAQRVVMMVPDSVLYAINETEAFYGELNYKDLFASTAGADDLRFFTDKLAHLDSLTRGPAWKRLVTKINQQNGTSFSPDSVAQVMTYSEKVMMEAFAPEQGMKALDIMLGNHAESMGKKIGGIETMRLQIGMLYDILDARVADTTLDMKDETRLNLLLKSVYLNERMDSLEKVLDQLNPTYRDIIFSRRNITMADSIARIAAREPSFFAIGCGHLVGKDGLIRQLRNKGYTVSPVHSGNRVSLLLIRDILAQQQKTNQPADAPKAMPDEERIEEIKDDQVISTAPAVPPKNNRPAGKRSTKRKAKS